MTFDIELQYNVILLNWIVTNYEESPIRAGGGVDSTPLVTIIYGTLHESDFKGQDQLVYS